MQKKECVGCRTHFKDNEKLPLEGISVELKNYNFPIKDSKNKWNLLKTICSLLNSKGGTIFIGAEDKTGEIKGYNAQRKELDDFRLFVQQLTERIKPAVDLSDKEEITVQYIPILTKDKFSGKHLIKIIVKQGDPHQLYCFSQKIQLQQSPQKTDEYEIVYAYKRLNAGNIKELKGYQLIQEATRKGKNPSQIANTFHEDCNPEPANLQTAISKIAFKNIYYSQSYTKLQKWLSSNLSKQGCGSQLISFDEEYDMLVIDYGSEENQLQRALTYLEKNVGQISSILPNYKFTRKQTFLDCFQFENVMEKVVQKKNIAQEEDQKDWEDDDESEQNWEDEDDEEQQTDTKTNNMMKGQNKFYPLQKNQNSEKKKYKKIEEPIQQNISSKNQVKQRQFQGEQRPFLGQQHHEQGQQNLQGQIAQQFNKNYSLTFTHILPARNKQLATYLQSLSDKPVDAKIYFNSVQLFFTDRKSLTRYSKLIEKLKNQLQQQYGFAQKMDIGQNLSQIEIRNYDRNKYESIKKYCQKFVSHDLEVCRTIKKGNKYSIGIKFKSTSAACKWLDSLLKDKGIKQFGIPGSEKGAAAKLKYHLLVSQL